MNKPIAKKSKPGKPAAKNQKNKKPGKKVITKPVRSLYPTDWFYFHTEDCPIRTLHAAAMTVPGLDVEIWPDLNVMELTLPNKNFIDFEGSEADFDDEAGKSFLTANKVKTCYLVSVEPTCGKEELELLKELAQKTGGFFAADTADFQPVVR